MKETRHKSAILALVATSWSSAVLAEDWGYTGEGGPDHWSELDAKYAMCAMGRNQSPIDLTNFIEAELKSLEFDDQSEAADIVNNGHTVQVNYASGSTDRGRSAVRAQAVPLPLP